MRCLDPIECRCLCHVDIATHIPVCAVCLTPLVQYTRRPGRWDRPTHPLAEKESGMCLTEDCSRRDCRVRPDEFRWLERGLFNMEDMPPYNGLHAIELGDLT